MISLKLSYPDMSLARWLGRERNAAKVGIASRKYPTTTLSDEEIHILGAKAEVAVARLFGIEPDRHFYATGGDGGVDLCYRGLTYDVKMRSRRDTDLMTQPDMYDFRADRIVLCWPGSSENVVDIIGLIARERFRREASEKLLRDSQRLVLPWRGLSPIGSGHPVG